MSTTSTPQQWRPRAVRGRDYALPDGAWWEYDYLAPHPLTWSELVDPEQLFDALIWERDTVCSDCFERIRDSDEGGSVVASADRLGTGEDPTTTRVRAGSGVVGHDGDDMDAYGAMRVHRGQLYCGNCGRPNGSARDSTMSLEDALDRVPALLARCREEYIAVDPDMVYTVVRRGKSVQKYQRHNRAIFAAALKLGVREARD